MSTSLLDLLHPSGEQGAGAGRYYGVVVGIVTNNQDPNNMARVRVKFPWLSDDNESWWARMAVPMAGSGRGSYFLPEVDDEVLVAFEHGDVRSPYIVGGLWNGKDSPPANNSDGKNNIRVIHKSVTDYLTDTKWSNTVKFYIDSKTTHFHLAVQCMMVMNTLVTGVSQSISQINSGSSMSVIHFIRW